jgi:hypothetical protein
MIALNAKTSPRDSVAALISNTKYFCVRNSYLAFLCNDREGNIDLVTRQTGL